MKFLLFCLNFQRKKLIICVLFFYVTTTSEIVIKPVKCVALLGNRGIAIFQKFEIISSSFSKILWNYLANLFNLMKEVYLNWIVIIYRCVYFIVDIEPFLCLKSFLLCLALRANREDVLLCCTSFCLEGFPLYTLPFLRAAQRIFFLPTR